MNAQPHVMADDDPKPPTERKRCGAKNRPGAKYPTCQAWPIHGRERCGKHGGLTPRAELSPHFRHGLRVRYLPPDLQEQHREATSDPELLKLRGDLAEVELLLTKLHSRLREGRAVPKDIELRILGMIEQRRKLIETEARRLRDLNLLIPAERHIQSQGWAAQATMEVVREMCTRGIDPGTNPDEWLQLVRLKYQRLRLPIVPGDDESGT